MERAQVPSASEDPSGKRKQSVDLSATNYQSHGDTSNTRDETVRQESSSLCSRCSSIDVESLFVDLETQYMKQMMTLGELGVEAELSSCSLCRLFHAVRIQGSPLIKNHALIKNYALYCIFPPNPYHTKDGTVLAVARDKFELGPKYEFALIMSTQEEGASCGFIACSSASRTAPHVNSLRAQSIDAISIDFDIIRGWIQRCGREHTGWRQCTQVESSALSPKELKLIDCEQRRIVPALPTYDYSALSYVWGTSRSGDDRCVHNELPTTLPRTIEDALKASKLLGLRYIWIDRYCIDQDNDVEKQIQIQQMDLIYQNAFVTIVAAAGTDPYFGLPGVGATPRTPQPSAWVGGQCLVSTLPDLQTLIKASRWWHRAWTYQESFFSTRRIVFTEQQVYYECRAGLAFEIIKGLSDKRRGIFDNQNDYEEYSPWKICSRLTDFCGRELSVGSDAIRAFEGVFHSFRKMKHPVFQYLGIPIVQSNPGRLEDEYGNLSKCGKAEAFAAGLSWCNKASGTRRSLFPTWSWAEWTVPINYETRPCETGLKLENEMPLKIFIENHDGSLSDMDEQSDVSLDMGIPGSSSRFIHIEAWTIPIDIQYLSDEMGGWIHSDEAHQCDGNYSGYFAAFQDDERTLWIPLFSLYQQYDKDSATQQSYAPDFQQGSLLGIVLGRCEILSSDDIDDEIFVMIVHEKEHHYERVGHMVIQYESYHSLANEGYFASVRSWPLCFRLRKRRTIRLG
ncbi:heterokaryon incompatibility protein-domain-containing protein [Alternaria rosae]|uniref:heterokaryon incompatibility protein-domain-containing protein n=1 Tax=Alternaria rosae TaxID=1187941 RepID=UPI001E8DE817|nr:heterokaryon incompatibility protein-domain-containing protein [Alternaria rosae]KAH6875065.1 heterokaryon incompatibility protein-domain-containing protein [Alternaria rosae]